MARRIDSRSEDLRDGENWSYCVRCMHLVAVGMDDPSWSSHSLPICEDCVGD